MEIKFKSHSLYAGGAYPCSKLSLVLIAVFSPSNKAYFSSCVLGLCPAFALFIRIHFLTTRTITTTKTTAATQIIRIPHQGNADVG